MNHQSSTVIVANGKFPEHSTPLKALADADIIVCCDGATKNVEKLGIIPTAIVGDLDSLSDDLKKKFEDRLFHNPDQESNDLTKAIKWCIDREYFDVTIVGATGLRDDHTLGNIGLLPSYSRLGVKVKMLTDTGFFVVLLETMRLDSYKGQQVSIFSPNNKTLITTNNLKYPIIKRSLAEFWMGTLNESLGDWFILEFGPGPLIIFQEY